MLYGAADPDIEETSNQEEHVGHMHVQLDIVVYHIAE